MINIKYKYLIKHECSSTLATQTLSFKWKIIFHLLKMSYSFNHLLLLKTMLASTHQDIHLHTLLMGIQKYKWQSFGKTFINSFKISFIQWFNSYPVKNWPPWNNPVLEKMLYTQRCLSNCLIRRGKIYIMFIKQI